MWSKRNKEAILLYFVDALLEAVGKTVAIASILP